MISFLRFISGFIYNLISLLIEAIPMSITCGNICVRKKQFLWEIDELDLLEELDKGDS